MPVITTQPISDNDFNTLTRRLKKFGIRHEIDAHWILTNNLIEVPEWYVRIFRNNEVVKLVYNLDSK